MASARHALLRLPAAPPAHNPVGDVVPTPGVGRRTPLQADGGLVDVVDQVLWRRGRSCQGGQGESQS